MTEEAIDDLDEIFEDYAAITTEDAHHDRETEFTSNDPGNSYNPESFEVAPVPKKRVVRNPRLKFDPDRLCGSRGIPVLLDHFKDIKFKGRGHEVEDLDHLLSTLELWTHRLFPSMKFADTLKQIEKLGKKRPVQTCAQKIRMDQPILSSDFIKDGADDDDSTAHNASTELDEPPMSAFDQLLEDQHVPDSHNSEVIDTASDSLDVTEEQKLRMEQNRKLALERRKARLAALHVITEEIGTDEAIHQEHVKVSVFDEELSNSDLTPDCMDEASPETCSKPAKRLRILSDSEESCNLDELVNNTVNDESDNIT